MPLPCSFSYYGKRDGALVKSDVRAVYEKGSADIKAKILSRLRILASLRRVEWHENYLKKLSGACDGLWEIRFKADNVQQRPLGYFANDTEFVILFWATERGNKFVPKKACEIALQRKAEVLTNPELKHGLWIALE